MVDPIVASYAQQGDDWTVTVSGHGKTLTDRAPGIIAARDTADQLVEELGPSAKGATVVHLLGGSALEFTAVYMAARLARPEPAPHDEPEAAPAQPTAPEKKPQTKSTRRPKGKFTADIGDALTASKPARMKVDLGPSRGTSGGPAKVAASGA